MCRILDAVAARAGIRSPLTAIVIKPIDCDKTVNPQRRDRIGQGLRRGHASYATGPQFEVTAGIYLMPDRGRANVWIEGDGIGTITIFETIACRHLSKRACRLAYKHLSTRKKVTWTVARLAVVAGGSYQPRVVLTDANCAALCGFSRKMQIDGWAARTARSIAVTASSISPVVSVGRNATLSAIKT